MDTYLLIYDGFALFEIVFTCLFMKRIGEIKVVALEEKEVVSVEGLTTKPNLLLREVNTSDVDLLVIPGGDARKIYGSPELDELLRELNSGKKVIAAICASPVKLAKAGILDGKRYTVDKPELVTYENDFRNSVFVDESVVVDGNIITAKPNGYLDFAVEIGKKFRVFESDKDIDETIKSLRYRKDRSN
ncbi:MAG TPA: DJ-1/PfpI family protein [Patescibacteria group bacterium]|nr:DJ-1/PfpI family protein [Patescibacteria group bacterium]